MNPDFDILRGDAESAAPYLRALLLEQGVDPEARLMFMSNSSDQPPGLGAQELMAADRAHEFDALTAIPHWRRKLSNFYRAPFDLAIPGVTAHRWETVEHYFQAYKLSLADPAVAETLSIDVTPPLADVPDDSAGRAARMQRKAILLDDATLHAWDQRKWNVMEAALNAKFESHADLRQVLLATRNAHLIHVPARAPRHGSTNRRGEFVDHTQWQLHAVRAAIVA